MGIKDPYLKFARDMDIIAYVFVGMVCAVGLATIFFDIWSKA